MKVVIVGGVAGGASAAARIRRLDEHAQIIMIERSGYVSYANCGLPYYVGGVIKEQAELTLQTPESFWDRFRIDVRVRQEVPKRKSPASQKPVGQKADLLFVISYRSLLPQKIQEVLDAAAQLLYLSGSYALQVAGIVYGKDSLGIRHTVNKDSRLPCGIIPMMASACLLIRWR